MGNSQDIDGLVEQVAGLKVAEKEDIEILAEWIQSGKAKKIIVLSGAGVSPIDEFVYTHPLALQTKDSRCLIIFCFAFML